MCGRFKLAPEDLHGRRRLRRIARPRQILMYLAHKDGSYSLNHIGRFLGGMHHTSIMHGVNRIHDMRLTHPKIAQYVEDCRAMIEPRRLSVLRDDVAAAKSAGAIRSPMMEAAPNG